MRSSWWDPCKQIRALYKSQRSHKRVCLLLPAPTMWECDEKLGMRTQKRAPTRTQPCGALISNFQLQNWEKWISVVCKSFSLWQCVITLQIKSHSYSEYFLSRHSRMWEWTCMSQPSTSCTVPEGQGTWLGAVLPKMQNKHPLDELHSPHRPHQSRWGLCFVPIIRGSVPWGLDATCAFSFLPLNGKQPCSFRHLLPGRSLGKAYPIRVSNTFPI